MKASRQSTILAPSLLAGDHASLLSSVRRVEGTGLEWLHIDIMDGHFVPNLTFGPGTVTALRGRTRLFFDVHLMLDNPQEYVTPFAQAGANLISIHIEPDIDHASILEEIRSLGCKCGIVLNPGTPAEKLKPVLPFVDLVLVMTVQPGFGGQSFREDMLPKIRTLDGWRKDRCFNWRLEVDGGVDLTTGPLCIEAGADTLVAGTAFFKAHDPVAFATKLMKRES